MTWMNDLRSILVTCALALMGLSPALAQQSATTNSPFDSLLIRDGDMLYGKLLAIDPQGVVRWKHPDAADPIEFKPERVTQVEFSPAKATASQSNSSCRVYFGNGDTVEGDLISCDRATLTLQTWYAEPPDHFANRAARPDPDSGIFAAPAGHFRRTHGNGRLDPG